MDAADAMIAAVALSIVTTLALTFGIGWFRAARRVRELERQILGAAPDAPVAHLEATVGDLADRVEELTDGQDFLSRLLAERREPPPGPRALPELPTPR